MSAGQKRASFTFEGGASVRTGDGTPVRIVRWYDREYTLG